MDQERKRNKMNVQYTLVDEQGTEDLPDDIPAHVVGKRDQSTEELSLLCYPTDLDLEPYWRFGPSEGRKIILDKLRSVSAETNKAVSQLSSARTGRNLQRYTQVINQCIRDGRSNALARLTTGAIPILNDGRILLVSSTKSGWVLPKGGWENDESLEVGAIREVFEEAGVTGLLGPPFPSITYETKKARKKRFASEASSNSHTEGSFSDAYLSDTCTESSLGGISSISIGERSTGPNGMSENAEFQSKPTETQQHSHNHMTLFPLYVQQVFDVWPEVDRSRRAFSIEQAEAVLADRPEYLSVLQVLKENNLHQVCLSSQSAKISE